MLGFSVAFRGFLLTICIVYGVSLIEKRLHPSSQRTHRQARRMQLRYDTKITIFGLQSRWDHLAQKPVCVCALPGPKSLCKACCASKCLTQFEMQWARASKTAVMFMWYVPCNQWPINEYSVGIAQLNIAELCQTRANSFERLVAADLQTGRRTAAAVAVGWTASFGSGRPPSI